jgi:hypothetical protein
MSYGGQGGWGTHGQQPPPPQYPPQYPPQWGPPEQRMNWGLVAIFLVVAAVLSGGAYYLYGVSCFNSEVALRNEHKAQGDVNQVVYDKFHKTITEQAGVVMASQDSIKELFKIIMDSKSGKAGAGKLVSFIREHNPNPDKALVENGLKFTKLMASIAGLREEFARAQKRSLEIERNHNDLIKGYWSRKMIINFGGDVTPLETQLVTSERTEGAFATGKDEALDPFGKNKKKAE